MAALTWQVDQGHSTIQKPAMSDSSSDDDIRKWHRRFAMECNNRAWRLSEAPTRSAAENTEMLAPVERGGVRRIAIGSCPCIARSRRACHAVCGCLLRERHLPREPAVGACIRSRSSLLMRHRPQETPGSIHATLRSRSRRARHCRMPRSARYSRPRFVVCRSLLDGGNDIDVPAHPTQPSSGGMS